MEVYRTFRFHAARFLPNLDDTHICKQMHGHTFNLTVYVNDTIDDKTGFVIDFFDIDKIFNKEIMPLIDHKNLNAVIGLENPTSENLCVWIWTKLIKHIPTISKLNLSEDHGTGIIYNGK